MISFVVHWLTTALALGVTAWIVPGVIIESLPALAVSAVVLGLVNAVVKPILVVLTLPLTFLTLAPRYIPAHEVQLFFILETALGPLWVWLVIQEEPTIKTIIGGVLIILTIFVHTFFDLKDSKAN